MTAIVIILIFIGLAFVFLSYKLGDKFEEEKEESDVIEVKISEELSEEQKKKIDEMITKYMDDVIADRLVLIEEKLSAIVNEKTLALGDYAVTVNEEIEKNHNEVLFLYSMLSDKHKEIIETATEVDNCKKDIQEMVTTSRETIIKTEEESLSEAIREIDEGILENQEEEKELDSNNEVILEMYKSGLSILDIAKQLGLGVGEVKLVVDLYQGVMK